MNAVHGYVPAGLAALAALAAFSAVDGTSAFAGTPAANGGFDYPASPGGSVVETYHGVKVTDRHRALERLDAPATKAWVEAQNALAQPYLEALPHREWAQQRLTEVWSYERFGIPREAAGRWFFMRNDGTQNQSVLYVTDSLRDDGRVLFDPNTARKDATIALTRFQPSPDGKLLAYAVSDGGSDWETWKWKRVADGTDLPDELHRIKFWNVSWARDGSGVYYSRYPALAQNGGNGRGDDSGRPEIYFHELGEPQSQDRRVFAITDHPTRVPSPEVTDDGRFLVISVYENTKASGITILDLTRQDAKPIPLFDRFDAEYYYIGGDARTLYFMTAAGAPRWHVLGVPTSNLSAEAARVVVPEAASAISDASFVGNRLVVNYLEDAHHVAKLFERDGKFVADVPLPGKGTAAGFEAQSLRPETFMSFGDFLTPTRILRLDTASNTVTPFRTPSIDADLSPYVTEQVFYRSRDGTRVPMFITSRRDMPRDGNQPVMLYGYGGFNVSLTPSFRPSLLTWLEMGGVYAEANLRGGGEYGEPWHDAGTLERKQNVFDDFIAAAEYLIREKYTRPEKIAIHGRSNGGLLVGAVMTQRPELFGAALPAVGVLDMLRYHLASANARQWSGDYGLSENRAEFEAQLAYSPVHNVEKGVCYPPTLVTTADRDDRVVPWHSYKFAAELQRVQSCAEPVLIRVETRAGHGAGKPLWMQIEDIADQWAFVANALEMPVPPAASTAAGAAITP